MNQLAPTPFSPYRIFSANAWAKFRADTPLTLTAEELERIRSMNDPVDLDEVKRIYLSLSRLLSAHVEASQLLFEQRQKFLSGQGSTQKTPFLIGIAGSVAVGKSTTARLLQLLLGRWPSSPKVALITTDGFLYPNAVLEAKGLMRRKGFPESYDVNAILRFLSDVKAGAPRVTAPVYSHFYYDVTPGKRETIDRPDILIFEGLNVLQVQKMPPDGMAVPFVSDFFDYSIYVDAEETDIHRWYIDRFMELRTTAFQQEESFFHRYAKIADAEARQIAEDLWANINAVNLHENILPTRPRADLILKKGPNHLTEQVALRKL
ncbi:type I pantothenate kinase [Fulvimarina sp. 2208YS6-2-32]|uniref:Pantothenate kinase n=1 Tax=Fulvimarina uroteuthidis TaxID=3098149 RepID=A0ABU5I6U7_9HYPH|nr:type I pantothenate kinase [Fulvimarina sp. 2208YS6-2-32]MDY8110845.1 type I pantothenate kinase [Fulvimarina sp. 2208YS6-2-32]